MKIQSVEIKNFKGISHKEVDLRGKSVYLIADNGRCKTSFIQAIWATLTGKEIPINPIKNGEREALIKVMLDNGYEAELKFNDSHPRGQFTLRDETGSSKGSPRTLIQNLIGKISFDPFDFINKSGKEQVKFIKEWANLDFTKLDSEYKEVFESRKTNNQEIKNLEGKINEMNISEMDIKMFAEPKDVTEIKQEIKDIDTFNENVNAAKEGLTALKKELETSEIEYNTIETELAAKHNYLKQLDVLEVLQVNLNEVLEQYNGSLQSFKPTVIGLLDIQTLTETTISQIKKLEETRIAKKQKIDLFDKRILEGDKWLIENPIKLSSELNERYEKILKYNAKVKDVQSCMSDLSRLDDMKAITAQYTKRLKEIDEEKVKAINEAKMPIRGLGFTEDYLTLNGLPFNEEQIPKSHIIRAGMEICAALNPHLRICRIKDGSLLGSIKHEVIHMADEEDIQMFIEIVDENVDSLEVVFIEN